MADLIVQSRFAGLDIEDDDALPSCSPKPKTNKVDIKKCDVSRKAKSNGNKAQTTNKKKKQKQNGPSSDQWEQWKQKDEQLVDGNFESELQQAILLSKLDYEEKKDVYKHIKKVADIEKKPEIRPNSKKMKKKTVMSLEQFNDMVNPAEDTKTNQDNEAIKEKEQKVIMTRDTEFFDRVKDDTKNELLREKIFERIKNQQNAPADEAMTRLQFTDALDKKNEEIAALHLEIGSLKEELHSVKTRNKKLCHILGQGEMKDKAEVLMEVERLRAVQAELTSELATLHTDLEKERSRDNKSRDKKHPNKKKSIRFDVSSEAVIAKETSCGTD